MCKFNPKNDSRRIDPCMKQFIETLNTLINPAWKTVACCCGHKKYPMTIVIENQNKGYHIEIFHGKILLRKKKFYKKDKQGYYYIPEVLEEINDT